MARKSVPSGAVARDARGDDWKVTAGKLDHVADAALQDRVSICHCAGTVAVEKRTHAIAGLPSGKSARSTEVAPRLGVTGQSCQPVPVHRDGRHGWTATLVRNHDPLRAGGELRPSRERVRRVDLLVLRYGDALSCAEIGQLLGLSTAAVRQRLSRAVRSLRDSHEEEKGAIAHE
jgi:hypothetical protein